MLNKLDKEIYRPDITNISPKAKQILGLPEFGDKVICFIAGWEKPRMDVQHERSHDSEFKAQEQYIFSFIRKSLFKENIFSYKVFRTFNQYYYEEKRKYKGEDSTLKALSVAIDKLDKDEKKFYKKKEVWKFHKLNQELDNLINDHLTILPDKQNLKAYFGTMDVIDFRSVNILCIDYRHFSKTIVFHFIKFVEGFYRQNRVEISKDLEPLYNLFRQVPTDVVFGTFNKLAKIVEKFYKNIATTEDNDIVEYLSANHVQNLNKPLFWENIKSQGYLCNFNSDGLAKGISEKRVDFRFFYSFESLLFYEINHCLLKTKRCLNCRFALPDNHKVKYCIKGMDNFESCLRQRNRKRQNKHYRLTKT